MTPRQLRYLALGDSYTIGEGMSEHESWPVRMAAKLRQEGIPLADPEIIARTGWTTDELDEGINRLRPQGPFDFVSLLIGVNNQYRGRGIDEYRHQFLALLSRAVGFAAGKASHVLVVSIPDWGATPFSDGRDCEVIASEIDRFNDVSREEARSIGAGFVDITPLSRTQGNLVVGDGLHPTAEAYSGWVELVLPAARALLQSVERAT